MTIHLGIDASNIRQGGGITHLSRLLSSADPLQHGIRQVTLWSGASTLADLPDRPWLDKRTCDNLNGKLHRRIFWQQYSLPRSLMSAQCDILFSPGGTLPYFCPIPMVAMSQNMLPFEPKEARLFGTFHLMRLKMFLLGQSQGRSFQRASGMIFLSRYAQDKLSGKLELDPKKTALIPHGIEKRFLQSPALGKLRDNYTTDNPFRLLYVSILMPYKHQIEVGQAVARLREKRLAISIDFVGPEWGNYGKIVTREFNKLDPEGAFLHLRGAMPFDRLHTLYDDADAFVFASSCENLPNILLEAMASGLPIMSSDRGPMPEVLGKAGLYFDPYSEESIALAISTMANNKKQGEKMAQLGHDRARNYAWSRCAEDTFGFIAKIARDAERKQT